MATSARVVPATVGGEEVFYFVLGRLNSGECTRRISKYHEIGGYLWRVEVILGGANHGGSSIQVTCGGPACAEGARGAEGDAVAHRGWRISARIRVILLHPLKWSQLGVDPQTTPRNASALCTEAFRGISNASAADAPMDLEVTGDTMLSSKLNTWIRYTFAPAACLQPGVFADKNWDALLCAAIEPNSAWCPVPVPLVPVDDSDSDDSNDSPPQSVSYGHVNEEKQMRAQTSSEILSDHLEVRAALVDKLIKLDEKLTKCNSTETSKVLEEEIERMKVAWECLPDLSMLV